MWQLLAAAGVLTLAATVLPKVLGSKKEALWYPRSILALGDSLTANPAYCSGLKDGLADTGSAVVCRGYVGQGSAVVASHLNEAWKMNATDVVILAGVNDLASGRSLDQIKANLEGLYRAAKNGGLRVVALTVTPWMDHAKGEKNRGRTDALNEWILSNPIPDAIVDTSVLGDHTGCLLPPYDSGDGLHMTSAGAEDLAALVLEEAFP